MKEFNCKYCDSKNLFIKETGTQTGLYCGNCGKWLKWLGKEELRLAKIFIKENNSMVEEDDDGGTLSHDDIKNIKELIEEFEGTIAEIKQIMGIN